MRGPPSAFNVRSTRKRGTMQHDSYDATCGICQANAGEGASQAVTVFENELWTVRQIGPALGVPGWMMLVTQRHAAGPAHLDDREAGSLGLLLPPSGAGPRTGDGRSPDLHGHDERELPSLPLPHGSPLREHAERCCRLGCLRSAPSHGRRGSRRGRRRDWARHRRLSGCTRQGSATRLSDKQFSGRYRARQSLRTPKPGGKHRVRL